MSGYTAELKEILRRAGCYFFGDHEIWQSSISGRRFPVDANIKSRHTANAILKQAGLPKHF